MQVAVECVKKHQAGIGAVERRFEAGNGRHVVSSLVSLGQKNCISEQGSASIASTSSNDGDAMISIAQGGGPARAFCRGRAGVVAGRGAAAVLQRQAACGAGQLRARRLDRHRGPAVCAAHRAASRGRAQRRRPEHGRRRRLQRRQLCRRGRAPRRHHARLHGRHRLAIRDRSRALPRRSAQLRVHRVPARHHGLLRAQGRRARHEAAGRHRPRDRISSPAATACTTRAIS